MNDIASSPQTSSDGHIRDRRPNVLISGGGVAGLALAYWLEKEGFHSTVVERSPALRQGGQAVDIRGVALDVVKAMDLHDDIYALRTRLRGMSVLDADGKEIERTEERTFSAGRLDSDDIEIFRDDLCRLLTDKAGAQVEYLYGDSIRELAQDGQGASVVFRGGQQRRFDLVVGADGIYSNVRKLVFGEDAPYLVPLGVTMALYTAPNLIELKHWQLMYRDGGVGYVIYPNRDQSELRLCIGFANNETVPKDDMAAQKAQVASECARLGGSIPRLLESLPDTDQFYYGELAQVRMPSWSDGCVVLAGDAAHCASPFSGQGTSLALVGAMVLAKELGRAKHDPAIAFAAYEQRMRPYVELNQALVDMHRRGPAPDEQMYAAKHGIDLGGLL